MHSPCSGARGSGVPILLADARALEEPRRYADADASHDEEGRLPHVKAGAPWTKSTRGLYRSVIKSN